VISTRLQKDLVQLSVFGSNVLTNDRSSVRMKNLLANTSNSLTQWLERLLNLIRDSKDTEDVEDTV